MRFVAESPLEITVLEKAQAALSGKRHDAYRTAVRAHASSPPLQQSNALDAIVSTTQRRATGATQNTDVSKNHNDFSNPTSQAVCLFPYGQFENIRCVGKDPKKSEQGQRGCSGPLPSMEEPCEKRRVELMLASSVLDCAAHTNNNAGGLVADVQQLQKSRLAGRPAVCSSCCLGLYQTQWRARGSRLLIVTISKKQKR